MIKFRRRPVVVDCDLAEIYLLISSKISTLPLFPMETLDQNQDLERTKMSWLVVDVNPFLFQAHFVT